MSEYKAGDRVIFSKVIPGHEPLWFVADLVEERRGSGWSASLVNPGNYYVKNGILGDMTVAEGFEMYIPEHSFKLVEDAIRHEPGEAQAEPDDWSDLPKPSSGALAELDQITSQFGTYLDNLVRTYEEFQKRGYPAANLLVETTMALEEYEVSDIASILAIAIRRLASDKIELPEFS